MHPTHQRQHKHHHENQTYPPSTHPRPSPPPFLSPDTPIRPIVVRTIIHALPTDLPVLVADTRVGRVNYEYEHECRVGVRVGT
ncbi:hypothetical protein MD484_g5670, partial [Candolleomyces efflorescens]